MNKGKTPIIEQSPLTRRSILFGLPAVFFGVGSISQAHYAKRVDTLICEEKDRDQMIDIKVGDITLSVHPGACSKNIDTHFLVTYFQDIQKSAKLQGVDLYIFSGTILKSPDRRREIGIIIKADQHAMDQSKGSQTRYYLFNIDKKRILPLPSVYQEDAIRMAESLLAEDKK